MTHRVVQDHWHQKKGERDNRQIKKKKEKTSAGPQRTGKNIKGCRQALHVYRASGEQKKARRMENFKLPTTKMSGRGNYGDEEDTPGKKRGRGLTPTHIAQRKCFRKGKK